MAEVEFGEHLRPSIERHVALAAQCVDVGGAFLARAANQAGSVLYRVHATLLIRALQDLRGCVLCSMAGYTVQAWSVAASAFEAAYMLGYVGRSTDRAEEWLGHSSETKSPAAVPKTVESTIELLQVEPNNPEKRAAAVSDAYGHYKYLCMAKHINPIYERDRYIFGVDGIPNLLLSPVVTKRRTSQARIGILVAIQSAHVALWAFDVMHLAEPGLVDAPLEDMARELGELLSSDLARDMSLIESQGDL
jgi:hypothetical protein